MDDSNLKLMYGIYMLNKPPLPNLSVASGTPSRFPPWTDNLPNGFCTFNAGRILPNAVCPMDGPGGVTVRAKKGKGKKKGVMAWWSVR